jgi:hypothetical protein
LISKKRAQWRHFFHLVRLRRNGTPKHDTSSRNFTAEPDSEETGPPDRINHSTFVGCNSEVVTTVLEGQCADILSQEVYERLCEWFQTGPDVIFENRHCSAFHFPRGGLFGGNYVRWNFLKTTQKPSEKVLHSYGNSGSRHLKWEFAK